MTESGQTSLSWCVADGGSCGHTLSGEGGLPTVPRETSIAIQSSSVLAVSSHSATVRRPGSRSTSVSPSPSSRAQRV